MRTVLVAALLLVLAVPATNGQMPTAMLDLQVQTPPEAVGPEGAPVTVKLTRICANPAMYMPDQIVRLEIRGIPGSVVDGPESVLFAAHPCAVQSSDEQVASFIVKLPADAPPATAFTYQVQAEPQHGDPVFGPPNSVEADFQLTSPAAPAGPEVDDVVDDANVTEEDLADAAESAHKAASEGGAVMDVPAPSWLFAVLGIGLAALRRR